MHPVPATLAIALLPIERIVQEREGQLAPAVAAELRSIVDRLRALMRSTSVLHREGEYWTLAHAGEVVRLRHGKGIACLADLLAQPGVELAALTLDGCGDAPLVAAIPHLDARAKAAYRDRVVALRDTIVDAYSRGDAARAEAAEAEIDAITHELAAGVGLGGRDRELGGAVERARVNVTRNLRTTIDRIAAASAKLGGHFRSSIRTGTFCCYRPDPTSDIRWAIAR